MIVRYSCAPSSLRSKRSIKKDYKRGGAWKGLTLDGVEFVRRFLMHIPPKGFVRIRHYGILSNYNKRKLNPICRNLIGCREFLRKFRNNDKVQAVKILYKKDVTVCPHCGGHVSYQVHNAQLLHKKNSA
ncbi:MAG: transposase [Roseburia faecis]|nr:transposase [Lachnospiraceae bacterium]MDY6280474.1 transposase [Roseburia faecis]MDY6361821.1 transposase [Lachnospiraceae bacterium]